MKTVTTDEKGRTVEVPDPMSNKLTVREYIKGMEMNLSHSRIWQYEMFEVQKESLFILTLQDKATLTSDVLILRDGAELTIKNESGIDNFEAKSINMGLKSKITMILPEEGEFVCERNEKGELLLSQKIYGPIVDFRKSKLVKTILDSVKYYEDSKSEDNIETLGKSGVMTFTNKKQYKLLKLTLTEGSIVTIDGDGEIEVTELNLAKNSVLNIKNPNFTFAKKFLINQEISSVIELTLPNKSHCSFKKSDEGFSYLQDNDGVEKDIHLTSDLKQAIINPKFIKLTDEFIKLTESEKEELDQRRIEEAKIRREEEKKITRIKIEEFEKELKEKREQEIKQEKIKQEKIKQDKIKQDKIKQEKIEDNKTSYLMPLKEVHKYLQDSHVESSNYHNTISLIGDDSSGKDDITKYDSSSDEN
jgi:hypothetical protein